MSTPAGWYPQPDGRQRYWDGELWTENFAAGVLPVTVVARKNWFLRHKVITGIGAFALLMMFVGIATVGGSKSDNIASVSDPVAIATTPDQAAIDKAAADKAAGEAASKQAAVDQAALDKAAADKAVADKAAESKAAADKIAASKAAAAKDAAAKAASAAAAPEVFKMPNLIGENLQLAQDKLQALGSYLMDQQDAAGLDRVQVLDLNWQVCKQDPAPGATVSVDAMVTLAAVKLAEQCP